MLYESIQDFDYKQYSGLDDKTLELLEKVGSESISPFNLEYQILNLVFLPNEIKDVSKVIKEVVGLCAKNRTLLAKMETYDKFLDEMDDIGSAKRIKNVATCFSAMVEIVERHLDELKGEWIENADDKDWVPTSTLFNRTKVRASDGRIIEKALQRMIDKGDVKKSERHKALAIMAQCYIDSLKKG